MLVNQLNLIPSTNTNFIKKYSTHHHIYKTLFPHKLQLEKTFTKNTVPSLHISNYFGLRVIN